MRFKILLIATLFTSAILSPVLADPGKDESGKGWEHQNKQSKEAWKREREYEREAAKERREFEREQRKHYEEIEREERKHFKEVEREHRKHLDEMDRKRNKHLREMNKIDRKMYQKDRYQPINGERVLEQEIDNVHRRAIDTLSEKTKPSSAWQQLWGTEE